MVVMPRQHGWRCEDRHDTHRDQYPGVGRLDLPLLEYSCIIQAMSGYLIYHPTRCTSTLDGVTVYHDRNAGNQDPYVWNRQFLHSYCHITQLKSTTEHVNFWVSGGNLRTFTQLYCDLIFVVAEKIFWEDANAIDQNNRMVDSDEAWHDHYKWFFQHWLKKRRRYTLKAHATRSFQPQDTHHQLIDIVPFFEANGISVEMLRQGLRAGFNSRPYWLGELAPHLYAWLDAQATIKLTGSQLEDIRRRHPELSSPIW